MRPRKLKRLLALSMFGAVIAGASLGTGIARADNASDYAANNATVICAVLDQYPSTAGVAGIGTAIVNEGYLSYYEAGRAIGIAVAVVCPWHQDVLDRFVATYTPVQSRVV